MGCGTTTVPNASPSEDELPATKVFADDTDPDLALLPVVESELLVQPFPGASEEKINAVYAAAGAAASKTLPEIGVTVLTTAEGATDEVAASLAESGLIEEIHRNYVFTAERVANDSLIADQTHLFFIDLPEAWDISTGDDAIVVGVVDSGIDESHPDLQDKILTGWNVYDESGDFGDEAGHGTQAAGVAAAASNNATGVAGVSWGSPIVAIRAADGTGRSTSRHLAAGILRAEEEGADVINVSFAPLWSNSIVQAAAERAQAQGSLVVISAGNGGRYRDADGFDAALFVGALVDDTRIAPFSDRGPFVDLVAPGTAIETTSLGGGYGPATGTSFAAPIVTGVAALMWSANPELRPTTIAQLLRDTSADLGNSGRDDTFGYGRVDAGAAVSAAAATVESRDDTPPRVRVLGPRSGSRQSRLFAARVSASDESGVADVVLSIDGAAFAVDTRAPYLFAVDPSAFGTGEHEITAVATDTNGNRSDAASVRVTFLTSRGSDPSGTVSFRSPRDGSIVQGDVTISADVASGDGLATIEWIIDGETVLTQAVSGTSSRVSYRWRSAAREDGAHTIVLRVISAEGDAFLGTLEVTSIR